MNKMKFITVEYQNLEFCIVFPHILIHKHVARCHRASGLVVRRAGFCWRNETDVNAWQAWGESISLNMKADPEKDSKLLNRDYP